MAGDAHELWPQFSPDGQWLAFTLEQSGSREVYVKSFPEAGGLHQISDGGGRGPVIWLPDGKGILFSNSDRTEVYRVDVELGDSPRFSKPRKVLGRVPEKVLGDFRSGYSPHPDGQRVLVIHPQIEVADHLAVIENWFPRLRELAPGGSSQ